MQAHETSLGFGALLCIRMFSISNSFLCYSNPAIPLYRSVFNFGNEDMEVTAPDGGEGDAASEAGKGRFKKEVSKLSYHSPPFGCVFRALVSQ